jgi:hypothetical protein
MKNQMAVAVWGYFWVFYSTGLKCLFLCQYYAGFVSMAYTYIHIHTYTHTPSHIYSDYLRGMVLWKSSTPNFLSFMVALILQHKKNVVGWECGLSSRALA